jgi:hypothetical protein
MTQRRDECVFLCDRFSELFFDRGSVRGGLFSLRIGLLKLSLQSLIFKSEFCCIHGVSYSHCTQRFVRNRIFLKKKNARRIGLNPASV